MSVTTISESIQPCFQGCPAFVVDRAVEWVVADMRRHGVEAPTVFEGAIEHGAKWHLFAMAEMPWTDQARARDEYALYVQLRHRAKIDEAYEEHGPAVSLRGY